MTQSHNIKNQYFNTDLIKELRPDGSYLNNRAYFSLTDEDVLCANLFISVFEAGDKLECNNEIIGIHTDITSVGTYKYPQILPLLPYYCKIYDFYRNFAWKQLCGSETYRHVLVEKFFFWIRDVKRYGTKNSPYCDEQIYQQVTSGRFTIKPFVSFYLRHVVKSNIIILPHSQRIIQLNGCTIEDILKECNRPLCQYAAQAEADLFKAIDDAIEEMDKNEE